MKNIFKILVLAMVVLVSSCSSDDDSNVNDPGLISRAVSIDMSLGMTNRSNIQHNYVYDGYSITLTGDIVEGEQTSYNQVNLQNYSIDIMVYGDVEITVTHPSFSANEVSAKAYYGIQNLNLPTATEEQVTAELILVQGFTIVTAINGAENLITGITINDAAVELDIPYYTATSYVKVLVENTLGNTLEGSHDVIFGEGSVYTVNAVNGTINLELPEFGDPNDGDLNDQITVNKGLFFKDGQGTIHSVEAIKVSNTATPENLESYVFGTNINYVSIYPEFGNPYEDHGTEGKTLKQVISNYTGHLKQDMSGDFYKYNEGIEETVNVGFNILIVYN